MKRIIFHMVGFVMFMLLSASTVFAEVPSFRFSDGSGNPGEIVTIDVSVANNPGIASFAFDLIYDENLLEWVDIREGKLNGIWDTEIGRSITWISADNFKDNKTVLSVTFKIKDGATSGKTEISLSYDADDVFNEKEENVYFSVVPGHIEIKGDKIGHDNAVDAGKETMFDTRVVDSHSLNETSIVNHETSPVDKGSNGNNDENRQQQVESGSEGMVNAESLLESAYGQTDDLSSVNQETEMMVSTEDSTLGTETYKNDEDADASFNNHKDTDAISDEGSMEASTGTFQYDGESVGDNRPILFLVPVALTVVAIVGIITVITRRKGDLS